MPAGRPRKVDPGSLYAFAHQFYWDFRRLSEGRLRSHFDKKQYEQLAEQIQAADIQLDDQQKARILEVAEEEIKDGRLQGSDREKRVRDLEDGHRAATRVGLLFDVEEKVRRAIRVPGEPEVIELLLNSGTTPEQVRQICNDAMMTRLVEVEPGVVKEVDVPAWPIPPGSTLPTYLSQYAAQYVAALHDPRFPHCDVSKRPSNRLKQFWFLSRALAGALFGITARTAINLVGSMRPEQVFHKSRAGKSVRKRKSKRITSRRH